MSLGVSSFKTGLAVAACWLASACSSRKATPFALPQKTFPGIASLSSNGDGTYTLTWPRTEASGVVFSIYARTDGGAFDFQNPEARTTFFSYRTGDLRARTIPTCFIVRAALEPGVEDGNSHELCTDGHALGAFAGLKTLTKNDDGTYLLAWDPLNFSDVEYAVYMNTSEAVTSFDFSAPPHAIVSGSIFKTPLFALGERHCFVVRYIGSNLPADANTLSLCTEETPPADFHGITAIEPVSSGLVRVRWAKSEHPDVVGYRVYKGNSFSPTDIVATVDGDQGSAFVDGLIPEQKYFFAVRSYNRFGGEDTNTLVMGPYSYSSPVAPRFDGLQSATATGRSVKLSWKPATGSPAHYRIYAGSAPFGQSPSIDYDNWVEEIRAPASEITRSCFENTKNNTRLCIGDKMSYAFAVRAEAGGLEEFNVRNVKVDVPDQGAPEFGGVAEATVSNGAIVVTWDKPVGETSRFELRLYSGADAPSGDCHTLAKGAASNVPGVMCIYSGACTKAYIVHGNDYAEFVERLGLTTQEATLCPNGKPAVVIAPIASGSSLKLTATAIDGECLDANGNLMGSGSCNRDANSTIKDISTGNLARPALGFVGAADSPTDQETPDTLPAEHHLYNPNQLRLRFFDGLGAEVVSAPAALPAGSDVVKFRIEAKECLLQEMNVTTHENVCTRWGAWTPFEGELAASSFTAPFAFPPSHYEGTFKSKIATQYCIAVRAVNAAGNESHAIAQQGLPVDGCPYLSGSTRIPAYPEFFGVNAAHVDPAFPKRIYVGWDKIAGDNTLSDFKIYYSDDYNKLTTFLRDCNRQAAGTALWNCTLPPEVKVAPAPADGNPNPPTGPLTFTLASAGCDSDLACEGLIDFGNDVQLAEKKFYFAVRGFTEAPGYSHDTPDVNTTKLSFTVPNTLPPEFTGIGAALPTPNAIDPSHKSDVQVSWTPVPERTAYPEATPAAGVTPTPFPPNAHSYMVYATSLGRRSDNTIYHCADGDRPSLPQATSDLRLVVAAEGGSSQVARISDLPDFQAYIFRVFARSVYGYSDANTRLECVDLPDRTPPEQTGRITATFVPGTVRKLTLQWPKASDGSGSGIAKYRLYWRAAGPTAAFPSTPQRELAVGSVACPGGICAYELGDSSADADGKTFADDALEDNKGYEFLVKALDLANNVSENDDLSEIATIIPQETPPVFGGATGATLNVTPGAGASSFSVTVSWTPVSNASGYLVYAGSCDTGILLGAGTRAGNSVTPTVPAGGSQFIVSAVSGTPLQDGSTCPTAHGNSSCTVTRRTYDFCVRAYRQVSGVAYFDTNAVTKSAAIEDYTSPTMGGAPTLSLDHAARKIHVVWPAASDPSGIKEYRVYLKPKNRDLNGDGDCLDAGEACYAFDFGTPVVTVASPGLAADLGPTELQQNQSYDVVVRAVDNGPKQNVSINTAAESILYRTQNSPQITSAPVVTPANPKTGDTITCTVAYADADGDDVTPSFTFRNTTKALNRATVTPNAGTTTASYQLKTFPAASNTALNADVRADAITCSVTITDSQGGTASATSAAVTVANTAPVLGLGAAASVQFADTGATLQNIAADLTDADGDTLTLEKKVGSDGCLLFPGPFTVPATAGTTAGAISGNTNSVSWAGKAPPIQVQTCTAVFQAKDQANALSTEATISVVVKNRPPGAFSASVTPATPNSDDTLSCVRTDAADPEGDSVTYAFEWRYGATEASAQAFVPAETTASLAPAKTVVGQTYWCVVTATDGRGTAPNQNSTVTKAATTIVNRNPATLAAPSLTDSADADTTLAIGEAATCSAGVPSDPDGSDEGALTVTYQFLLEDSPGAGTYQVVQTGSSQSYTTLAGQAQQNLKCRALVSDGHGGTSTTPDSVTLLIGNNAPTLAAIAPLNVPAGTALAAGAAVLVGSDANGDSLTYVKTADSCGAFTIEAINGNHEIRGTTPAAAVAQPQGACTVKVKAFDGNAYSNEITVTFTITNAAPTLACTTTSLDEGLTHSASLCTASDTDIGTTLSLAYTSDGCNLAALTAFNGTTLSLSNPFQMPSASCTSTVRVTDNAGASSAPATISFTIPATPSLALAWGGAPTLDRQCNLTLPATATFTGGRAYASAQGYLLPQATAAADCRSSSYPPSTAYPLSFSWSSPNLGASCQSGSGCYVPTFTDTTNGFNSCIRVTADNGSTYMISRVLKPSASAAQTLRAPAATTTYLGDAMPGRQAPYAGCLGSRLGFDDESGTPCNGLKGMLAAGYNTTCALVKQAASPGISRLSCWGDNASSQLGRTGAASFASGAEVDRESGFADGGYSIVAVASGERHTCILRTINTTPPTQGQVRCFGANDWGQSGDGLAGTQLDAGAAPADNVHPLAQAPVATDEFLAGGIAAIAAGKDHSCALSTSGEVRCWGRNHKGQLGFAIANGSPLPVQAIASGAVGIAVGDNHSCALLSDGTAKCWGDNGAGQLGDGTQSDRSAAVAVNGITNAVRLAAGRSHTCALLSDGTVRCWGGGASGQLGNDAWLDSTAPVTVTDGVSPLAGAVAIASGGDTSCALLADGKVRCWGANAKGQVGDRTTTAKKIATPVKLAGGADLTGAQAISVGQEHACVLLAGGNGKCWGGNGFGQLGTGTANATPNDLGADASLGTGLTTHRRSCNLYTVAP